ncbi:RNA polymerase subunit sigma [Alkalihalobacillus sp. CinArs1]|uniref:RNA polymerase subunit sigma n=1 Tax=Alkalihalobacillus sp. CinArs1 TaxID=2995314 RepID=UPI0022DE676A|nr:RNA polymerase subunit sigma [Alkalihalobacillus sp. CinArs1]
MKRLIVPITVGIGLLVGCSDGDVSSVEGGKMKDNEKEVEVQAMEDVFLDAHEMTAYEHFAEDFNEGHLADLNPLSIAKLHLYASLQQNHDVHYALYTDREGHVAWSKAEDDKIPDRDRGTRESVLANIEGIQNGKFVQSDEITGYIEFHNERGTQGYQMVKDQDGNWRVAFMPIQ